MPSVDELIKQGLKLEQEQFSKEKILSEKDYVNVRQYVYKHETDILELYKQLGKYMIMDETDRKLCFLWVLGTNHHQLSTHYPYIFINAPKSSGKSKLTKIMTWSAYNGYLSTNISSAGIYNLITEESATIGFDESELLSDRERSGDINNILLSGFETGNTVIRVPKTEDGVNKLKEYRTYSPKILSNIMGLSDDALESRCIPINLSRSNNKKKSNIYPRKDDIVFTNIRLNSLRWVYDNWDSIVREYKTLNSFSDFTGRTFNLFKPLIITCKLAVPEWLPEIEQALIKKSEEMDFNLNQDSQEAMLLNAMIQEYDFSQFKMFIQPEKIRERIISQKFNNENQKWLTYHFINKLMFRLGFRKRTRRSDGIFYEIMRDDLVDRLKNYKIVTDEELEEIEKQTVI